MPSLASIKRKKGGKPSLAAISGNGGGEKKASLAALGRKPKATGLGAIVSKKRQAEIPKPSKHAKTISGVRFDNCRQSPDGEWWLVDVINGDKMRTFHNRYGAWFHDEGNGSTKGVVMWEPEGCYPELSDNQSPRRLTMTIFGYWASELKRMGIPATQREKELAREKAEKEAAEQAKAEAAKAKKKTTRKTTAKRTLAGLGKK